ncbi:succinate dehydrogenase hydrophobic membrane anchor subunit [Actinospica durhamensis]|uniref:Succinate dehydrogenase hydrophobic membrane anchor subunit n=1 Tax=Actinospica durhamensis TaxID=1508375 RepID=A0A941IQD2_9ACTN|nr:succinate dehydrogenase hydrophobic membrane anchor subunit [Actinospica durhamensis]MBR7834087.1 succinate dehydrogenase hydrophobic membrane anchor subunit [Actinospica durhamensis]
MTTTPAIEAPRAPKTGQKLRSRRTSRAGRTNFELYSWLFMRFSGLLLTFLVLGHLFIMLVLDGGVEKIDFAFVAGRWASPFWQIWDLLTLWLATLHGTNGLRTVINDYAERNGTRVTLKTLLYTASIWMVFLGSLVIFTFDPSIKA